MRPQVNDLLDVLHAAIIRACGGLFAIFHSRIMADGVGQKRSKSKTKSKGFNGELSLMVAILRTCVC